MKNNGFQRRTVPSGFKDHKNFDSFIQKSLDKFAFVEALPQMYEAAGIYSQYIISNKSTIPDLIIYNKTFNKNDCFESCKSRSYNSFPRVRFILHTQQQQQHQQQLQKEREKGKGKSKGNRDRYTFEYKELRDNDSYYYRKNDEDEEPEWGNDDVTQYKHSKVIFQALPERSFSEDKEDEKEDNSAENIISTDAIFDIIREDNGNEVGNLKEQVILNNNNDNKEQSIAIQQENDAKVIAEIEEHPKEILTNPNQFFGRLQENDRKRQEKSLVITSSNPMEDDSKVTKSVTIKKDEESIIDKEKDLKVKEETVKNVLQSQSQLQGEIQGQQNNGESPQAQMPFMPNVPPYMYYPMPQFPIPPFNFPMNPMNSINPIIPMNPLNPMNPMNPLNPLNPMNPMPMPVPQMGMNMGMIPTPFQFNQDDDEDDDDEEDEDPMLNNFNENCNRFNPSVFLENPALIVKKNLTVNNWFVMKDNKILGNYNSETLLFFLVEQIRRENTFDGISISDYQTDVFFRPNNLYDILKKNVPKLKKKMMQQNMQNMIGAQGNNINPMGTMAMNIAMNNMAMAMNMNNNTMHPHNKQQVPKQQPQAQKPQNNINQRHQNNQKKK